MLARFVALASLLGVLVVAASAAASLSSPDAISESLSPVSFSRGFCTPLPDTAYSTNIVFKSASTAPTNWIDVYQDNNVATKTRPSLGTGSTPAWFHDARFVVIWHGGGSGTDWTAGKPMCFGLGWNAQACNPYAASPTGAREVVGELLTGFGDKARFALSRKDIRANGLTITAVPMQAGDMLCIRFYG